MRDDDVLWEHQETKNITSSLFQRLTDEVHGDTMPELVDPLREKLRADMENHPPHTDDFEIVERIDRIIEANPDLDEKFRIFVKAAFQAGPQGDGSRQHFQVAGDSMVDLKS
jgi:hypothetical protein